MLDFLHDSVQWAANAKEYIGACAAAVSTGQVFRTGPNGEKPRWSPVRVTEIAIVLVPVVFSSGGAWYMINDMKHQAEKDRAFYMEQILQLKADLVAVTANNARDIKSLEDKLYDHVKEGKK